MIIFRHLALLTVVSSTLSLVSCDKPQEANSESAPVPSRAETGEFSDQLSEVVSQLDTHGSAFSVTYIDNDLADLGGVVDGLLDVAKKNDQGVPQDLSVATIIEDLGLNQVSAMGRSSRWNGKSWHNRRFFETGGDRDGVLSLMGGEGETWQAGDFAPEGADLVFECELDLRKVRQMLEKITSTFGSEVEDEVIRSMQEKLAPGLTLGGLLNELKVHTTIVVSMHEKKRWEVNDSVELPVMDVAVKMQAGPWLWSLISESLEEMMDVSEKSGVITMTSKESMSSPMGKLNPTLVYDKNENTYWFAFNASYLSQCRSEKNTLGESAEFQQVTSGFPKKGNGLVYLSPALCEELKQQVFAAKEKVSLGADEKKLIDAVMNGMVGDWIKRPTPGYAWCLSNTPQGILIVGNAPMPDKGYGIFGGVAPIAALSAMATPVILKQQKKATMTEAISNAKQIFFLMVEFDQDFGSFPNKETAKEWPGATTKSSNALLRQFFLGGYVRSEEIFYAKTSFSHKPDGKIGTDANKFAQALATGESGFAYITGQSTSDNSGRPLLCAPMMPNGLKFDPIPFGGKAVVLRIDGAVKAYRINANGEVDLPNGKTLFENGEDTVWGIDGFKPEMLVLPEITQ